VFYLDIDEQQLNGPNALFSLLQDDEQQLRQLVLVILTQ
jgi:hypothetical protein